MKYILIMMLLGGCTYVDVQVENLDITIEGELNGTKLQAEEVEVHTDAGTTTDLYGW